LAERMQQLTFIRPGAFEWHDVPAPQLAAPTDAIVRPLAVARCDLDLYIATGFIPFPGPFAFGHEMVGEVVDAGEVSGVLPGQRVVVPFQISCGKCPPCQRGLTASCAAVPPYAAFGLGGGRTEYGGALSGAVRVPYADYMLVPLPAGVDPIVAASAADNIPDGWRAVAPQLAAAPAA
jgi:threonine dehydrogenase-like Zn-dependent dehydrogenase